MAWLAEPQDMPVEQTDHISSVIKHELWPNPLKYYFVEAEEEEEEVGAEEAEGGEQAEEGEEYEGLEDYEETEGLANGQEDAEPGVLATGEGEDGGGDGAGAGAESVEYLEDEEEGVFDEELDEAVDLEGEEEGGAGEVELQQGGTAAGDGQQAAATEGEGEEEPQDYDDD
jgi:hypothetical protein